MSEGVPRRRAYIVVGLFALFGLITSVATLLTARSRLSLEAELFVMVVGLTALLAATVAVWIAGRAPVREDLLALSVGLTGLSLGASLFPLSQYVERPTLEAVPLAAANAGIIFGTLGLLRFFSLFPKPITPEGQANLYSSRLSELSGQKKQRFQRDLDRTTRWVAKLQGKGTWRFANLAALLVSVTILAGYLDVPRGMRGATWIVVIGPTLLAIAWGAPLAAALASDAFSGSRGGDRRRMMWMRWGLTAAMVSIFLFAALLALGIMFGFESTALVAALAVTLPSPPLWFLVGLIIAVFYEGSVDPSLAIQRTTVYGTLGILFVFFFAGLGNVVSEFVEERLGLPGIVGTGLYGGTVAVLLLPLRGWFTRATARWVPKLEGDEAVKSA